MLFVLYINDMPEVVSESSDILFADDTKIFREISSIETATDYNMI